MKVLTVGPKNAKTVLGLSCTFAHQGAVLQEKAPPHRTLPLAREAKIPPEQSAAKVIKAALMLVRKTA